MMSNKEVVNQLEETQATVGEEEQHESMEVAEDDDRGLQAHRGDHGVHQDEAGQVGDALRCLEEEDDLVLKSSDKDYLSNLPVYWAKETNHRLGDGGPGQVREVEARTGGDEEEQVHHLFQGGALDEEPTVDLEQAEEHVQGQGGGHGDREQAPADDEAALRHQGVGDGEDYVSPMVDNGKMMTPMMKSRLKQSSSDSGSGKRRKARGRRVLDVIEPGMVQLRIENYLTTLQKNVSPSKKLKFETDQGPSKTKIVGTVKRKINQLESPSQQPKRRINQIGTSFYRNNLESQ